MDLELIFVLGCVLTAFSIPAIVSAFSDGRTPRYLVVIILIGVVMIGYAVNGRPGFVYFRHLARCICKGHWPLYRLIPLAPT